MPAAWAAPRASATWRATPAASRGGSGPADRILSFNVPPAASSIAMYGEPSSVSPESKTRITFGWSRDATFLISRPNRSTNSGVCA
jgi:hypothetical protein